MLVRYLPDRVQRRLDRCTDIITGNTPTGNTKGGGGGGDTDADTWFIVKATDP